MSALLLVPALPLLAAMAALVLPRSKGRQPVSGPLTAAATACSLIVLLAIHGKTLALNAGWFTSGGRALSIGLELNGLTWFAALLVAAIAFAVTLYAIGYMAGEPRAATFFAELALFISAMLTLVLSSSLLLLYAAWEIVGLSSWLLIGFHRQDERAAAAAARAFLMTRAADTGFLLAWLLVFTHLGSVDIHDLLAASAGGAISQPFATLLALLFFAAAAGKSAQLPLSIWLPDAMVAPTPVSALLHSATMAAAGVYLLLRLFPLLAAAPAALAVILWLGFLTAVVAALIACADMDLKRILAWSTISQLGEMMIAIGLGAPLAAALHLMAHACFKSTLFMSAGIVDKYAGTRDLRQIGGLRRAVPLTAFCFAVGALALAGIEPTLTETSHDAILVAALRAGSLQACGVLLLLLLAGAYIGRAGFTVFAGSGRSPQNRSAASRGTMQAGMLLAAIAAASMTLPVIALPALLPFQKDSGSSWAVHGLALAAGATGLMLGAASAHWRGAAPLLGSFAALPQVLPAVARLPVRAAFAAAVAAERIECGFDLFARQLAQLVWAAAGGTRSPSPVSAAALARGLDTAGMRLVRFAMEAASGSEQAETRGFEAGGAQLARRLQHAGDRLRALQTGKLYLYTLGLFAWTLAVLLAAAVALAP